MKGPRSLGILVALAAACAAPGARAAPPAQLDRLDQAIRAQVSEIVARAERDGLPTRPLLAKALEGASKGASGERIVLAVRAQAEACRRGRAALGAASTEAEIVAAAGAIAAGVPSDTLVGLRAARPHGSLVVPIVVLSDMVARRVPVATASHAVLASTRAGARDPDLFSLRQRVDEAIRSGMNPGDAATLHSQAWLSRRSRSNVGETRRPATIPSGK